MDILTILQTNQPLFIIIIGCLGLIVGSFLNVVIYRLPIILKNEYELSCLTYLKQKLSAKSENINLATPGSTCPECKTTILWWQNIPVISYMILRGKCYNCKSHISWRYPAVEIITSIASIFVAINLISYLQIFAMLILTWMLIAAIFIDIEHQLLPDQITLPLVWLGLLVNINGTFASIQNAIIGAISGYLFLWSIAKIFKLIRKIDGMGNGDFKLFAVFGAWLGWQLLPIIVIASSGMGAIIGLSLIISKKYNFSKQLPFGPYLATAGWLAFFYGEPLLNWYQRLIF